MNYLFNHEYLNSEQLNGLNSYKYASIDTSPLSTYIMHPFWNSAVKVLPMWLAPNLMTFLGFNCLIAGYLLIAIFDVNFDAVDLNTNKFLVPSWVWAILTVLQILSHNLDGLDGKQARRTQTSSALGELFDHGLDSWAAGLFPIPFFSVISRRPPFGITVYKMHFLLWLIFVSFFVSHWEKYNTGILYLPWSYDLSMIGLTVCFFLVSIFTPALFWFYIPVLEMSFSQFILAALIVSVLFLSFPISVYNVASAYRKNLHQWNSLLEILRPFSSMLVLFSMSTCWAFYSKNDIISIHPRLFFLGIATAFSSLTCRLIVAEMSSTQCKPFNYSLIPYILSVLISCCVNVSYLTESRILTLYVVYIVIAHAHYGGCVVRQIAKHLDIDVFTISPPLPSQS